VITTEQLLAVGIASGSITDRVTAGRLHRIHRGVYAVGHPQLSTEGRWMSAVLACGQGAVLSHRSAAELWGIRHRRVRGPDSRESGPIDVSVPGTAGRRRRDGIALRRSSTLSTDECTRRVGIPVTTPQRTLTDLRRVIPEPEFAAALREAEFLRLPIGDPIAVDRARTELESRFLSLCRRHRIPKPAANATVDRFEVDFLWRKQRLIVEVDGWESHRTRSAFEEDRVRDARLKVHGYEVLRFTWRQVTSDPVGVARTLRILLRARS
jgi:very-short-patch-repair endonuclease